MDKTFRFFLSGQTTKDSSSTTQPVMANKGLDLQYNRESRAMATSGLRDNVNINNKPYNMQNPKDMKGKDADKYFYILWHS